MMTALRPSFIAALLSLALGPAEATAQAASAPPSSEPDASAEQPSPRPAPPAPQQSGAPAPPQESDPTATAPAGQSAPGAAAAAGQSAPDSEQSGEPSGQDASGAGTSAGSQAGPGGTPERPLTPQEQARFDAEAALEQARTRLNERFETLQALVLELEDDHAALTSGPGAATRKQALVVAMADALPAAASQLDAAAAQGRRPNRSSRTRILAETLSEPVAATSPVDSRLGLWLVDRVAEDLAARGNLDGVDDRTLLTLVDQQFEPGESWYAFWNRSFHQSLPAARAYAEAHEDYEQAGLALDRLRFPERYGPRGEKAPAGMVIVPGGLYELGPNAGYGRPVRKLNLKPFAMDRREVTNREYATFVNASQPSQRRDLLPRDWTLDDTGRALVPSDRANHPVMRVSWDQAAAFARWVGKRLPTEDEWEAAAAGFRGQAYPWGNAWQPGRCNGAGANRSTVPVESFPSSRSPAGCFDMAGNVWEWTATLDDNTDVDELPDGPVNVIIRGGSFADDREALNTRYRWIAPGHGTFSYPGYDRPIGFRCVSDL